MNETTREFKEKQKHEGLIRINKWQLIENVKKDFENGVLNCSTAINININTGSGNNQVRYIPKLNWLTGEEKEIVKKFETESDGLVYHVVKTQTDMGIMYSLLYVCKTEEEWEIDHEDLEDLTQVCYVHNVSCPDFSEFGSCLFEQRFGGLLRVL
ncbi:hypothetical protein [Candidatus Enterococcus ikei]|uniref:Uncharacterized protein n=1 Tax=Candidatus Enterococcus ikei TaxID=2815326 RepID=A0ABS3H1V1_9ENTE|nr:hypothetical protein [Enterococcus sp. DIV0869a]MBO0441508.1 hypothetical protein [Enterococcus sp. DIV0869a]